jgi:polyferredoxin
MIMIHFLQNHLRRIVQILFLTLILWIGVEFTLFVAQLRSNGHVTLTRPPGVEGFLPISGLINLKYWLLTGDFTLIHPAGLVLLLVFMAMAVFLKKGFCSWICPIGLLSEYLAKIHLLLFDRPRRLTAWLDYPLRSLKYCLLFFFVYAVFFEMDAPALHRFIYSPYNKVADIKMLLFFTEASMLTLRILAILLVLSVLTPYFWCRYLCPYGALLGGLSFFSLFKIRRDKTTCIDCEKCTRVCPANINVHKTETIWSDECHACYQCVAACPVKDTLYLSAINKKVKLSKGKFAIVLLLLFIVGTGLAMMLGLWQNTITVAEYRLHVQHLNDPGYQHNRGEVPEQTPEDLAPGESGSIR